MKITTDLAYKYVLKNKKRSMYNIFTIIIVTILITMIITLISSYQQYLVNSSRNKKNWEVEFKNITYADALKIEKDENVKEISIWQSLGISEENFGKNLAIKLNVKALDENALKNSNIKIIEGRLPKNSNELIISNANDIIISQENPTNIAIGENINITLNGIQKDYIVVGKMENSEFDKASMNFECKIGAFTYFDTYNINNDAIVDVTMITKNIQKIYQTGNKLAKEINIDINQLKENVTEEEQLKNILNGIEINKNMPNIEYNEELLNYECVIEGNSEFAKKLLIVGGISIVILSIISILMINASFKMTYWDRIRELGMLSSIGMNKKQQNNVINAETRILGVIGIVIGNILGFILSHIGINIINNYIKLIRNSFIFKIDNNIELYIKVPFIAIILIILIIWIIIKISSTLPMKKINKISIIEAIKNKINIKVTEKQVKTPNLIEKIFKEEGVLAYKNIKRDSSKYKTIVYSLISSLVLFLSINGLITNIDKKSNIGKNNMYDDYIIEIQPIESNDGIIDIGKVEDIMKYLKENKLVYDCYASMQPLNDTKLELKEEQISETVKEMMNDNVIKLTKNRNQNIEMNLKYCWIFGDAYNQILEKSGVKELKDGEVIITNSIAEKTKYGKNTNLTNLKIGDKYKLNVVEWKGKNSIIEKEFTIVGIVDNFEPYINSKFSGDITINQLISPQSAIKLIKELNYISFAQINIVTDQEKAEKIDKCMNDIKMMYGKNDSVIGNNKLPIDLSKYKNSINPEETTKISTEKISEMNERNILKILLYSFVGVVIVIAIINTFNTIYASIILRKKEFATLKSIGMSNKQIRKMTSLEGIFYGLDSIIFGIIISIFILYIMYKIMIETRVYLFEISWVSILGSIIVMYVVIFFAIICARRKIKNKNIIEEVREENI